MLEGEAGRLLESNQDRFSVMGTTAHVIVLGGTPALLQHARARLADLEQRWSRFLEDSELSLMNRSHLGPVVVSRETFALVTAAVDAWRLTGGRFDPTIGLTMDHAGYDKPFGQMTPHIPDPGTRHTAAATPTPEHLTLYPECCAVQVAEGVQLDLGGIAKGAAADLVGAELLDAGAAGCCINLGGDMTMVGVAPRPEGWRVRLDCPGSARVLDVGIARGAVCTSTTRNRRWLGTQETEHHIRDPNTGRSSGTDLQTVTVVSATAAQAEVLAKWALLVGQSDGEALIHGAEATGVMVTAAGAVVPLAGLEPFLTAAHPAKTG